jgi:hypothetical protein
MIFSLIDRIIVATLEEYNMYAIRAMKEQFIMISNINVEFINLENI